MKENYIFTKLKKKQTIDYNNSKYD